MEFNDYQTAKTLFGEVCDLPKAAQHKRLQELTDNTDLINYVEKLLTQDDTHHPRVAQAVLNTLTDVAADDLKVGTTLGAWKLKKEIGHGGMGAVFLAQRVDGHFEQTAAVKVLHGIPSAKALEYLARERQILATLTHPNIARLYDGGATAHGQPFLVMEYVEGVSISRYVRKNNLSKNDVLNLIVDVCTAVSFAHQRLIVHCDIKPSNILVTPLGRPMLLDFGIARLLEVGEDPSVPSVAFSADVRSSHDRDSHVTQTKARAFTPRYASPEQQSGGTLTTATDVFSLGKMLGELLNSQIANTLKMPDNRASWGFDKADVLSAGSKPDAELLAIIAKAAHADPQRRYVTANGLATDIKRYQQRLPVSAHPTSATYIARKFSQRNWPWLVAASVFVVALGLAGLRVVAERNRAQGAELIALQQRDATVAAQALALRERDGAQQARGAAERERDRAATAEIATANQRDRAQNAEALAVAQRDRARDAEANATQSNEFLVSVFRSGEPGAKAGNVQVSVLLERAEARIDTELKGQPQVQARLYSTLGTIQRGMAEYVKAERLHKRAIEVQKSAPVVSAPKLAGKDAVAATGAAAKQQALALAGQYFAQANDLYVNGKTAEALASAREALTLREKYSAAKSLEMGESISQIGQLLTGVGNLTESTDYLERGLSIIKIAAPQGEEMAFALANFAWQQHRLGNAARAEDLGKQALALRVVQGGSIDAPYAIKQREDLSQIIAGVGRFAEAEALTKQTIAARTALHGRDNMRVANGLQRLAVFLVKQDRALEALPHYVESREIMIKTASTELPHYRSVNLNLGLAHLKLGDAAAAAAYVQLAVDYTRKFAVVEGNAKLIEYLCLLAAAYTSQQQFDEARLRLTEALAIAQSKPDQVAEVTSVMVQRSYLEALAGQFDAAQFALITPPKAPAQLAMLARVRALITKSNDVNVAVAHHEAAEQFWATHHGSNDSAAWLEKIPRATLLIQHGTLEQKLAGTTLAQQIYAQVASKLVKTAPVLHTLRQLMNAPQPSSVALKVREPA